jgi:hypothetical protein
MVFIPIQSLWYQVSHESQHTPAVFQVTALLQEPQGCLGVQTKMHYYSEANYPSPITSYKFAINNSFNVEIATEILYIIKHVLRRRLKPDLLVLLYLCANCMKSITMTKSSKVLYFSYRDSRCHDRIIAGFTTTYAINAYHH